MNTETRWIAALGLLLLLQAPILAAANPPPPETVVEETANRVLTALRQNGDRFRKQPENLYVLVDEAILPLIDFEAMSRLVLGPHWRSATPEQRERFISAFRDMLVRSYTTQLIDHVDKEIVVLPTRRPPGEAVATVNTEIVIGQGRANLPVTYSMRYVDDRWRVYDLTVEGLSFVKNFRTSFDTEVRDKGLDALIDRLAKTEAAEVPTP